MFLKLSKYLIVSLLGATACTAAYIVPWYENDIDVGETWGSANSKAATVCTVSSSFTAC
jgi:hypothetical protein